MMLPVHSYTAQVHKVKRLRLARGQSWGDASVRSSHSMATSLRIPWIFLWSLLLFWIVEIPNKEEHSEQRTVLKFLANNGLSPTQSWSRLHKVFGQNVLSKNSLPVALLVQQWRNIKARGEYFEGSHLEIDPEGDHSLFVHHGDTEDKDEDSGDSSN